MITQNFTDKLVLLFEDSDSIISNSYELINTFTGEKTFGEIIDNKIELKIKDGLYVLNIENEDSESFKKCISVYYNSLPEFINQIKTLLCGCSNCDKDENRIYKTYNFVIEYLLSTGLLCNFVSTKYYSNVNFNKYTEAHLYKQYYGEFKLDNKKNIMTFLVGIYIELYLESCKVVGLVQEDLDKINLQFKITEIERCLYKNNYDICNIKNLIVDLKCNCKC